MTMTAAGYVLVASVVSLAAFVRALLHPLYSCSNHRSPPVPPTHPNTESSGFKTNWKFKVVLIVQLKHALAKQRLTPRLHPSLYTVSGTNKEGDLRSAPLRVQFLE